MGAPSEGTAEEATPHLQGQERLFMEEGASPLSLQGVKQGKRLGTDPKLKILNTKKGARGAAQVV
jgi:hypothetical protein